MYSTRCTVVASKHGEWSTAANPYLLLNYLISKKMPPARVNMTSCHRYIASSCSPVCWEARYTAGVVGGWGSHLEATRINIDLDRMLNFKSFLLYGS